ncbi:MAG: GGDEF domain-containing protein [Vulcanimicrobiota bacterium]
MQEIRDFNSGCLHRRLINACKALMTRGIPFALIIIDIDHFRSYNDIHGAFEGDRLLNRFVSMLKKFMIRGDLLCNAGEDSYALILKERDWKDYAPQVEAIRYEFLVRFHQEPAKLTISMGGALFFTPTFNVHGLISEAYKALDTSKKLGGNRVTFIPPHPPKLPPGYRVPVCPPHIPPALSPGYEKEFPEGIQT